jgi:hypothetical protein
METLYEEGRKRERRNEKMNKQLYMPFCNINVPLAKRSESLRRFFFRDPKRYAWLHTMPAACRKKQEGDLYLYSWILQKVHPSARRAQGMLMSVDASIVALAHQ